jgi:hypothetical protein
MWQTKRFATRKEMRQWIAENAAIYEIDEVPVNNGYAVQYRNLGA